MSKKVESVVEALAERPEWAEPVREFFAGGKHKGILNVLAANPAELRDCAHLGLWKSRFVIPREITPIRDPSAVNYQFEVAKWIGLNHEALAGKKVFEYNAGFGLALLVGEAFGINMSGACASTRHTVATLLGGVLHGIPITLDDAVDLDVVIFSQCFYEKDMAETNLELARQVARSGARAIISSTSLWEGTNKYVRLEPGEAELLLKTTYAGTTRYVFELA